MSIITIDNLHFSYTAGKPILKGLNMAVPEAAIYGFLGPNGAGKSTTIRTLLGLQRAKAGGISFWNTPLQQLIPSIYKRVGALIESPSFYPQLSARDNLRILAEYHTVSISRFDEVLERVGLHDDQHKLTSKFSTGMKQRLGLALAMLHQPEVLILDEPTNGLDPNGISEIRALMLELQKEGTTILLSSHLLSEIEKVASVVGIIRDGRLAFEGTIADLQSLQSKQKSVQIKVSAPDLAAQHLPDQSVNVSDGILSISIQSMEDIPGIIRTLSANDHDIYEVVPQSRALEDLFMLITNKNTPNVHS